HPRLVDYFPTRKRSPHRKRSIVRRERERVREKMASMARHELREALEQVERVVRARGGFGVVLHAKSAEVGDLQALARDVVEVRVGALRADRERVEIDAEAVVLRGDLDAPGGEVLHRLVRAAVAEFELVGLAAEGQGEELVAEADAEDGDLAEQ